MPEVISGNFFFFACTSRATAGGLTSEPDGEMGTLSAGEEGRPLSMSKGSSRRGLFFFSVSKSLSSPVPWLCPSDRVRTPDRKSAISSWQDRSSSKISLLVTYTWKRIAKLAFWFKTSRFISKIGNWSQNLAHLNWLEMDTAVNLMRLQTNGERFRIWINLFSLRSLGNIHRLR